MPAAAATTPEIPAIRAPDPQAMDRIGATLAAVLAAGDVLAISGPLGAGKSHLCRAIVRALLGDPQAEVPSPSYTLVNVYAASPAEVWHADLYRIADPDELQELGLDEAADHAIVLVEWPERWAALPARRAEIAILPSPSGSRTLTLNPVGPDWDDLLGAWRHLQ